MMLCAVLLLSFISAISSAENPITKALGITWGNIDVDKSGTLEKEEFFTRIFTSYDSNQDKKVTDAEFLKGWLNTYNHQRDAGVNLFNQVDVNGDHVWTDFDLTAIYTAMDTNESGIVTKDEFITYVSAVLIKANFVPVGGAVG